MYSFLERISCIIVAGGSTSTGVEAITEDLVMNQLPVLSQTTMNSSMVFHDGAILLCGGEYNLQECLQLDHGTWKEHSTLNQYRDYHSVVTTQIATFLLGGSFSRETYEYLPKGSSAWLMGKTEIPGGFRDGCAVAVKSDQEIWLIGGVGTWKRILSFNINDHTFKELPFQLNKGRVVHRCAFIPNTKKVMVTGEYYDNSTEILDTESGTVTLASPLNSERHSHGMGVLTIKGEDRLAVFGGYDGRNFLDSVELYNAKTEKWETSEIKLNVGKSEFGFLTVKLREILSELQCNKN